jgi:hypothetical protein
MKDKNTLIKINAGIHSVCAPVLSKEKNQAIGAPYETAMCEILPVLNEPPYTPMKEIDCPKNLMQK